MVQDFIQVAVFEDAHSGFRGSAFGADLFNQLFKGGVSVPDGFNHILKYAQGDCFADCDVPGQPGAKSMGLGIAKTSWTTVILPPYSSSIILILFVYLYFL